MANLCAAVINHANSVGKNLKAILNKLYKKFKNYFGIIKLWNWSRDMYLDSIAIFGLKDGETDLCINQTKKKDTQSNLCVSLLLPAWGVFMAPLFFILY